MPIFVSDLGLDFLSSSYFWDASHKLRFRMHSLLDECGQSRIHNTLYHSFQAIEKTKTIKQTKNHSFYHDFAFFFSLLTHYASHKQNMGKQWRPRSEAAQRGV